MHLPFEIIHIIYKYGDIDLKQAFHKLFGHETFLRSKIILDSNHELCLTHLISFKYTNYIVLQELSKNFSFL